MTAIGRGAGVLGVLLCALLIGLCGALTSVASATAPLKIDQPAPSSDRTPTLEGTTGDEADPITVLLYAGSKAEGEPLATIDVPAESIVMGAWSATVPSPLQPGVYTALAEQEAGKLKSEPVTFTIDTPPLVTIDEPPAETNDAKPLLSGTAGSAPGDEQQVQVKIIHATGTPFPVASGTAKVSAGTWSFQAPHLADGSYIASVEQLNEAGEEDLAEETFTIDTVAPVLTFTKPAEGELLSTTTPTYEGTAGSAAGDQPTVTVTIHAGTSDAGTIVQTLSLTRAQWLAGAPGPPLSNGIYTAVAEQADGAGNVGSAEVTFGVAVAPPSGGGTGATAAAAAPPSASFQSFPAHPVAGQLVSLVSTSTDPGSPITALAWSLLPGAGFNAGGPVLETTFAAPGSYQVRLLATNAAGVSAIATETILVAPAQAALMQPFPVVRIAGTDNRKGAKIALLTVEAPLGATVRVSCHGKGCPKKRVSVRAVTHTRGNGTALLSFARFERLLRAGTVLEVRVSKPGTIGKYTSFTVRHGKLPLRSDQCLGVSKPIACPA